MSRWLTIAFSGIFFLITACTKKAEDVSATAPTDTTASNSLSYSGPKVDESANTNSSLTLPPGLGNPQQMNSAVPQKRAGKKAKHHGKKGKRKKSRRSRRRGR